MSRAEAREIEEDRRRGNPSFAVGDKVVVDSRWPPHVVESVEWFGGWPARKDEPAEPAGWVFEVDGDMVPADALEHWDEDDDRNEAAA